MPYFLDAYLLIRNQKRRIHGYVGEYSKHPEGILVHGHVIVTGDIVSGPTYTVKANLKDYINFRGIEMELFNRKNSDAADNEYRTVAHGLRDQLTSKLGEMQPADRERLLQYFDMQVIIEQKHSDRIKLINRHVIRILSNRKQILSIMRSSEHATTKRVSRERPVSIYRR